MKPLLKPRRRKRSVLVVDDEQVNRELLEAILMLDYDVHTVSNGREAMDALHNAEEPYSLILLDLLMPQMNGFQVLEACRADKTLCEIPIIVMTSEKSTEVRSIRMGADDFISKPYRMPEVILARCERIIAHSEERRLLRSVEKDRLTGLYILPFFEVYACQLANDVRGKLDVAAITVQTSDGNTDDALLKATADAINNVLLGGIGLACRTHGARFLVCREHSEDYSALTAQMQSELADANAVIQVGVYADINKTEEPEVWIQKAIAAL